MYSNKSSMNSFMTNLSKEGRVFRAPHMTVFLKIGKETTKGAYTILEYLMDPGLKGPAPHYHKHTDESFYVIEGKVDFLLNDRIITAQQGDTLFVPRGTVHKFSNHSLREYARVLTIFSPGGFEGYFEEYETAKRLNDQETLKQIKEKYDNHYL